MSTTTPTLSKNYPEFLGYTLLPVQGPPAGENCAICRQHFVKTQERDLRDELGHGTTIQSNILAAALAAARQEETPHDIVVRIRDCGHLFHRDCLCSWVTGEISAILPRRSCPLCRTELVRYGLSARAQDLLLKCRRVALAVSQLEVRYDNAYEPLRRLEEVEQEVAGVMEDFSNETNNLSKPKKDSLFTQLRNVLNKEKIWDRDLEYLEQLLLDGHSIPESIQTWYVYKLETTEEHLQARSKEISTQLEPLRLQLLQFRVTLRYFFVDVAKACGYSDSQVSSMEQVHFFSPPVSGHYNELLNTSAEGGRDPEDTRRRLERIGRFSCGLCNMVAYMRYQATKLEASANVEQQDHDTDLALSVNRHEEEVDHYETDEDESVEWEDVLSGGNQAAEATGVDVLENFGVVG